MNPATPAPQVLSPNWRPALFAAILGAVTFAVTIGGTYIYDDLSILLDDPRMTMPSLWYVFWTEGYRIGGIDRLYRPLTSMSFAVQFWLHGDRPWAFHLVNVLLHAGAAAAVAEFARRLWAAPAWGTRAAYVAGLLFAVHPVHTEAVAWLVGRAELLCTLATFAGLCLVMRRPLTTGRAAAIFGCFVVAVLSKDQGVLFPLLVLLVALLRWVMTPRGSRQPLGKPERARVKWLAVSLLYGLSGYLVYRETILPFWWDRSQLDWSMQPMIRSAGADRWLLPLVLLGRYATVLVAPLHLSIEYGGDVIGSTVRYREPFFFLGVAAALAWAAGMAIAIRRRCWPSAFCLLGFALAYGMVSNVATLIGTIFGERLIYLPSAFLLILAGAGLVRLPLPKAATTSLVALLLALGAARSITYAHQWNDRASFYERSLASQPRSVRLHELVFSEHRARKDWPAAGEVAERCISQVPQAYEGHLLLGEAAAQQGDLATARTALFAAAKRGAGDSSRGLARLIAQRGGFAPPATEPATQPADTRPADR